MTDEAKLVARAAMHELEEAGIAALSAPSGNRSFYFLAKNAPQVLAAVVETAVKSEGLEREVWYEILCKSDPIIWGASTQRYKLLIDMIPMAIDLESIDRTDGAMAHSVRNLLKLTLRNFEFKGNPEFLNAALIALYLKRAHWVFHKMKDSEIRMLEPDIERISRDIPGVLEILPLLKERKTVERGIVSALLEARTPSLSTGVL